MFTNSGKSTIIGPSDSIAIFLTRQSISCQVRALRLASGSGIVTYIEIDISTDRIPKLASQTSRVTIREVPRSIQYRQKGAKWIRR